MMNRSTLTASLLLAHGLVACSGTPSQDSGTPPLDASDASLVNDVPSALPDTAVADAPNTPVDVADGSAQSDVATPSDTNVSMDDGAVCAAPRTACPVGGCVDLMSDVMHCGSCDVFCPAVPNGTPRCVQGTCNRSCNMGFELLGMQCVQALPAPRPVSPLSLGDVSSLRPTLKWQLPMGADGAQVELCRDRACTMVIETIRIVGSTARPVNALPARSTVFWRLRPTVAMSTGMSTSPTWLFHTPAVAATGGADLSVHPHPDFNGDGIDDLAVGSPNANPGARMRAGTVTIFHGVAGSTPMTPTLTLEGAVDSSRFGSSLASAGDVNGDGFGDLIVAANAASPGGRVNAGSVSIFHGGPTGLNMVAARVLEGAVAQDSFGASVANVGDLNLDGYAEVAVGATGADFAGRSNAGSVSIYSGSAMGVGAVAARVLEGSANDDNLGNAVSAGDFNGDGFGDVVVSAFRADPGGRADAGTVSIFLGAMAGLAAMPARVLEGVGAGDLFGRTLGSNGDVNNDGFSDLVIGATFANPGGRSHAGTASFYLGSAGAIPAAPTRVLEGASADDLYGIAASLSGDINGDGFNDVIIGVQAGDAVGRANTGLANIFLGTAMGINAAPTRVLEGTAGFDAFSSGAMCSDFNGDGFADAIVGASLQSPGGRFTVGTVSIFTGSMAGVSAPPVRIYEGVDSMSLFGISFAD